MIPHQHTNSKSPGKNTSKLVVSSCKTTSCIVFMAAILWGVFTLAQLIYHLQSSFPDSSPHENAEILRKHFQQQSKKFESTVDSNQSLEMEARNATTTGTQKQQQQKQQQQHQRNVVPPHQFNNTTTDNNPPQEQDYHVLPPLRSVVQRKTKEIIGDVTPFLQFAILGFPKCGTTSMMAWLNAAAKDEVYIPQAEVKHLSHKKPHKLVEHMSQNSPPKNVHRGYKNPTELEMPWGLRVLMTYWPEIRILIGIRHPIRWFESLYNFRAHNNQFLEKHKQHHILHPNMMIGKCGSGMQSVCTARAAYHVYLAQLNKTQLLPDEMELMKVQGVALSSIQALDVNTEQVKVFLYDVDQLKQNNDENALAFRKDMTRFLNLSALLPAVHHVRPGKQLDEESLALANSTKIDICNASYAPTRKALMESSHKTATWIQNYFLQSPDVFVSSKDYFVNDILQSYHVDPCE